MRQRPTTLGCVSLLALLAALHGGTPAQAVSLSRQCRQACRDEIVACVAAGGRARACRKSVLGRCKGEGVAACQGQANADGDRGADAGNRRRRDRTTTTTTTSPSTTTMTQQPTTTTTSSTATSSTTPTTRPPITTSTTQSPTTTSATSSSTTTSTTQPPTTGPVTSLHYAPNNNFDSSGNYAPGKTGFNLADVSSVSELDSLPNGVEGLVWLGLCNGADSSFISAVQPFIGNPKLFGFYLMDEPDPTGQWAPLCPPANLMDESDWIHANVPGAQTFIVMMNFNTSVAPTYANTYNPGNSHIDLYGIDPYPCRTETNGCDYDMITVAVAAAKSSGIPLGSIVPVYQAFGGGSWADDGGGKYTLPTSSQAQQIMSTWAPLVPNPVFDYAYSWGKIGRAHV